MTGRPGAQPAPITDTFTITIICIFISIVGQFLAGRQACMDRSSFIHATHWHAPDWLFPNASTATFHSYQTVPFAFQIRLKKEAPRPSERGYSLTLAMHLMSIDFGRMVLLSRSIQEINLQTTRPLRRRLGRICSCFAGWIFSSLVGYASRSRCSVRSVPLHPVARACSSLLPAFVAAGACPPSSLQIAGRCRASRRTLEAVAHTRGRASRSSPAECWWTCRQLRRRRCVGSAPPIPPQPRSFHLRCCSIPKEATETNVPPNTHTHTS